MGGTQRQWRWRRNALKEAEESFGPEDARVATSLNNLAEMYRAQVRHAEAEPLWKRALEIRKKALGPDHPDVSTLMNNLAGAYFELGDFAKAEYMLTGALRILEASLGTAHPDVATTLGNLAAIYRAQGKGPRGSSALRQDTCHKRADPRTGSS